MNFMAAVQSTVIYAIYFTVAWSTTRNKYGSAVIYPVCFTVAWLTTQSKYGSAVIYSSTLFVSLWHGQLHETNMEVL